MDMLAYIDSRLSCWRAALKRAEGRYHSAAQSVDERQRQGHLAECRKCSAVIKSWRCCGRRSWTVGRKIDSELRAQIVDAYIADPAIRQKDLAQRYHIGVSTVQRIIHDQVEAGKCIQPDRRRRSVKRNADGSEGILEGEMDKRHAERMAEQHPRTSDWMDHITPIHQRKMELENAIEHKQAELEKAKQEYRDFLATLRQLLGESV